MKPVSALQDKISLYLNWNKARVEFVAQFILSLITLRTCSLYRLCVAFQREASSASSYKRIQRFFRSYTFDPSSIARLLVTLIPLEKEWVLCLDRTNWKLGQKEINHLILAVACQGVAIPLFWCNLNKAGNSESQERINLVKRFLQTFPDQKIRYLTADREFIGHHRLSWLAEHQILFRVRIPKSTQVARAGSVPIAVKFHFLDLTCNTWNVIPRPCRVWGMDLYVAGSLSDKDYCYVISQERPESMIADYRTRWEIESLFSCLKKRGFDMESCRLTLPERTDKLTALLAIAFCWSYSEGIQKSALTPARIAKTRFGQYWPAESKFHQGLQYLQEILLNPVKLKREFMRALAVFVP